MSISGVSATYEPLRLLVDSDAEIRFTLTLNGAVWPDLATAEVRLLAKPSSIDEDASALWELSSSNPGEISVDAVAGTATASIDRTKLPDSGNYWHRLDVIDVAGEKRVARYGPLEIVPV